MATPYQRAGLKWVEHAKTLNHLVPPGEIESKLISINELKRHNKKDDAWCSYHNRVYDITSYIPYHPGGFASLQSYLGKDISRPATSIHPRVKVDELLEKLCVGVLDCSEEVAENNIPVPEDSPGERGSIFDLRHNKE